MTLQETLANLYSLELEVCNLKNGLEKALNQKEIMSRKLLDQLENKIGRRDGVALELTAGSKRFVAIVHKQSHIYNASTSIEFKPLLDPQT